MSEGYHACWQPELTRVPIYTPRLSIMIRDVPINTDLYAAALEALLAISTFKGVCFFFLGCTISALFIWLSERSAPGIFPGEKRYPVSLMDGFDDAFYWSVTTGTSTGYGDKVPVTNIGRVWAMAWMLIGILLFALVGGSLTNEILERTTDSTIYSLSDIGAGSSIAGIGGNTFAIEQVLLTQTKATNFTECAVDECVKLLQAGEVDAVVGSYAALLAAREASEIERKASTSKLDEQNTPRIYVTGGLFESDFTFTYVSPSINCVLLHVRHTLLSWSNNPNTRPRA